MAQSGVHISRSGSVFINSPARSSSSPAAAAFVDPYRGVSRSSSDLTSSTPLRAAASSSFAQSRGSAGNAGPSSSVASYALRLNAGPVSVTSSRRNGVGSGFGRSSEKSPYPSARRALSTATPTPTTTTTTTTFVASSSARKAARKSPAARIAEGGPSATHSLMKTATHASHVASTLQQTLRDRGREQNELHSSIRQYESRVGLLTATVQRLEAENARALAESSDLQEKLEEAERRAAEAEHDNEMQCAQAEYDGQAASARYQEVNTRLAASESNSAALVTELEQAQDKASAAEAQAREFKTRADSEAQQVAALRNEIEEIRAAQEAAEVERTRREAAAEAARAQEESSQGGLSRAEAAQAAIIRDQLIDDLRFKDDVIMQLRDEVDELKGLEEQRKALELALETSKRALDGAIEDRVGVDEEVEALQAEKEELLLAVSESRRVLLGMRDSLQTLSGRADSADEAVRQLEQAAAAAQAESRAQLVARQKAETEAQAAHDEAVAANESAEAEARAAAQLRQQNETFSSAIAEATVENSRLRADARASQTRAEQAMADAESVRRQLVDQTTAATAADDRLVAMSRENAELTSTLQQVDSAFRRALEDLTALQNRAEEAEGRASSLHGQLADARAEFERTADALGSERDARRLVEARKEELRSELEAAQEREAGVNRQLKEKYEDMAALTVKTRHDLQQRDEALSSLQAEVSRLREQLEGKLAAEKALLDGIREAATTTTTATTTLKPNGDRGRSRELLPSSSSRGSSGRFGRVGQHGSDQQQQQGSPNVHISRSGSVFIQ